jgi:uncharacterized repeat protein (TIGR02543 family)
MTKTGYTFDGWYKENAKTTRWDFDTDIVTENITLYGEWIKNPVVTFLVDGVVNKTVDVPPGSKVGMPNLAAKANYDLDGWYTSAAYTTKWDFGTGTVAADITLYARRQPLTFAVLLADIAANATASTEKTYTLPSGSETYILAITPLTTANSPAQVTIDGGGRVVTGSTNRITIGAGVTLTLKNITFKKVPFTAAAGGKLVLDNGAVVTENAGAGVTVSGTSATAKGTLEMKAGASVTKNVDSGVRLEGTGVFTMNGGSIRDNTSLSYGGGVKVDGGLFTMSGGTISGNEVIYEGGGVALTGTGGTFTMSGGTISGNTANNRGGGVALTGTDGTFTMSGGTISGNTASNDGGGVAILGTRSKFYMNGGVITGNKAQNNGCGGGVYGESHDAVFNMTAGEISNNTGREGGGVSLWSNSNLSFTMSGGVIKNNQATGNGGGVHLLLDNTFSMTGGEITGNTAAVNGGGVAAPAISGGPQIGGANPGAAKGWIHGNTATNNPATNDV